MAATAIFASFIPRMFISMCLHFKPFIKTLTHDSPSCTPVYLASEFHKKRLQLDK